MLFCYDANSRVNVSWLVEGVKYRGFSAKQKASAWDGVRQKAVISAFAIVVLVLVDNNNNRSSSGFLSVVIVVVAHVNTQRQRIQRGKMRWTIPLLSCRALRGIPQAARPFRWVREIFLFPRPSQRFPREHFSSSCTRHRNNCIPKRRCIERMMMTIDKLNGPYFHCTLSTINVIIWFLFKLFIY